MTGLVNFGVIFFVAVGAIIVGVLTASSDVFGYDWPIFPALIVAVIVGGFFGWLLAYPTARLRTCLLYTSPSPRDVEESRMPSSA